MSHDQKGGTKEGSTTLNTNTGYKNAAGTQRIGALNPARAKGYYVIKDNYRAGI